MKKKISRQRILYVQMKDVFKVRILRRLSHKKENVTATAFSVFRGSRNILEGIDPQGRKGSLSPATEAFFQYPSRKSNQNQNKTILLSKPKMKADTEELNSNILLSFILSSWLLTVIFYASWITLIDFFIQGRQIRTNES